MDIEKLIERLRDRSKPRKPAQSPGTAWTGGFVKDQLSEDAATALSTLQAENEKLRAELEWVKRQTAERSRQWVI